MTTEKEPVFQEFKAPLINIIGMTDLLKQSSLTEEQKTFVRNIEESANALLVHVKKMVSTHEAEQEAPASANLNEAVNELRQLVLSQTEAAVDNTKKEKLSNIRVLIVEDNPLLQLVIMKQLAHLGINAEAVSDGQAALLAAHKFDLIFMDCRLPVLDGYEATRAIRQANKSGKPIKIVALTAGYEEQTLERCLEAGMDDCLIKPVSSQALRIIIEKWFLIPHESSTHRI